MPYAPEGDPLTAEIVFVGEAPARNEMREGRPFVGLSGMVHNECMEHAGIMRSYTYQTNVFDFMVKKQKGKSNIYNEAGDLLFSDTKEGFTPLGMKSVERLEQELSRTKANVIVPLGVPAFRAICGGRGILKWRGSILPATMRSIFGRKCVPSIHPANALHGQYINRYIIKADYKKAKLQAAFKEIIRPPYHFHLNPTYGQSLEFLDRLAKDIPKYACDIEVGYVHPDVDPIAQVTRIAFAWSHNEAVSIPYADGGWSEQQEADLWLATARALETEGPIKIFHNGIFDCQFLLFVHGVAVAPQIEDTMIAHHIVYTDFRKSLAFCASIHTEQPYWKHMVKHGEIENPEG